MAIQIHRATVKDIHVVAMLLMAVHDPHRNAMPHRYKPLSPDNPKLLAHYEEQLADTQKTYTFIASEDGQPVGFVHCFLYRIPDNPFVYSLVNFHIDQFAVLASHQGKGIGSDLLAYAKNMATSLGAERLSLGVTAFNTDAIRFYERHGFTVGSYRMVLPISD